MVKIYTPNQKKVKDYEIGKKTKVTINGSSVIPILADKIYKSPYSAIRELYVNEVTAVKKALRINPKLKPEIKITLNTNTRELIIKGVDSLGIDLETFNHILAVMGNSGNNKGNETGYYGLGFYSFVKISERIIINSFSLESGEKWAQIAKSALEFEQLKQGTFKELDKTGFEITLTVKNDLDFDKIESRIKEISKLSGVKTSYMVDSVNIPLEQYDNLEHYFKSQYSEYFDDNANYSIMYKHINNDDFELIIGHTAGNTETTQEAFLINVPIKLEFNHNPRICLLNVKNERIYKPSADRERFSEKDEENLLNAVNELNFDKSDLIDEIKNLDDFYKSKFRYFHHSIGEKLDLDTYVKTGLKRSSWRNSLEAERLIDILPAQKPDKFLISKTLRTKSFTKLKGQNIFAVQCAKEWNYDNFINAGFIDIDNGKKKKSRSSTIHLTKNFKFHSYYNNYDELPDNALAVIRVDDVRTTNLKNQIKLDKIYFITKKANFESDLEIEVDELHTLLNKDSIYATNHGFMSIKEILKSKYQRLYENDNQDFKLNDESRYSGKYMMNLFNYKSDKLIIRFNESDESKILESILYMKHGYLYTENFDFKAINDKINKEIFEEWKTTITNKHLKILLNSSSPQWNDEDKKALTELQKEIDKNDS